MTTEGALQMGTTGEGGNLMTMLIQQLAEELGLSELIKGVTDKLRVSPTPGSLLMLLVPLAEVNRYAIGKFSLNSTLAWGNPIMGGLVLDRDEVQQSLTRLLEGVSLSPSPADKRMQEEGLIARGYFGEEYHIRTSLSVIKAYWELYCNIPPWCGI